MTAPPKRQSISSSGSSSARCFCRLSTGRGAHARVASGQVRRPQVNWRRLCNKRRSQEPLNSRVHQVSRRRSSGDVPGCDWPYLAVAGCTWLYLDVPGRTWRPNQKTSVAVAQLRATRFTIIATALWRDFIAPLIDFPPNQRASLDGRQSNERTAPRRLSTHLCQVSPRMWTKVERPLESLAQPTTITSRTAQWPSG